MTIHYLGNGVTAESEGNGLTLRSSRTGVSHVVALNRQQLEVLIEFIDEVVFKDDNAKARKAFQNAKGAARGT